jgi:hypothetical protein
MRITTTPAELVAAGCWQQACDLTGISEWAVNEGQMNSDTEITLTEAQASELGLTRSLPVPRDTTDAAKEQSR